MSAAAKVFGGVGGAFLLLGLLATCARRLIFRNRGPVSEIYRTVSARDILKQAPPRGIRELLQRVWRSCCSLSPRHRRGVTRRHARSAGALIDRAVRSYSVDAPLVVVGKHAARNAERLAAISSSRSSTSASASFSTASQPLECWVRSRRSRFSLRSQRSTRS